MAKAEVSNVLKLHQEQKEIAGLYRATSQTHGVAHTCYQKKQFLYLIIMV